MPCEYFPQAVATVLSMPRRSQDKISLGMLMAICRACSCSSNARLQTPFFFPGQGMYACDCTMSGTIQGSAARYPSGWRRGAWFCLLTVVHPFVLWCSARRATVPSRHGRESYDGLGGLVKECCMLIGAATPGLPDCAVYLEAGAECELPHFVSALHPSLRLNVCQDIPARSVDQA